MFLWGFLVDLIHTKNNIFVDSSNLISRWVSNLSHCQHKVQYLLFKTCIVESTWKKFILLGDSCILQRYAVHNRHTMVKVFKLPEVSSSTGKDIWSLCRKSPFWITAKTKLILHGVVLDPWRLRPNKKSVQVTFGLWCLVIAS